MQEEISNLRVDNARLTQQLASLQGSQAKPAASAASLEVQKRLAGREAELEAARKELEAMKSRQDEVERDLRDQLAKAQAENQSLAAAMQRLKGQERTGTELSGQLAEAQSTIEQLKKENAGLQAQRAALADQPAAAPSVPAAAPAGTSDADELARLKDDLKRANSKVEMTVRSFTLLQQENERLKAQLAQARTP
jgi:chromosome segregation ATPase